MYIREHYVPRPAFSASWDDGRSGGAACRVLSSHDPDLRAASRRSARIAPTGRLLRSRRYRQRSVATGVPARRRRAPTRRRRGQRVLGKSPELLDQPWSVAARNRSYLSAQALAARGWATDKSRGRTARTWVGDPATTCICARTNLVGRAWRARVRLTMLMTDLCPSAGVNADSIFTAGQDRFILGCASRHKDSQNQQTQSRVCTTHGSLHAHPGR